MRVPGPVAVALPVAGPGSGPAVGPTGPARAAARRRRVGVWLLPACFTLVSGIAVARSLGSLAVLAHVRVFWPDLAVAALAYPVFAAGRGWRFRRLLGAPRGRRETVAVGWLYSAACSILPGGLGEASLPALYRGPGQAPRAVAAVLVTRIQDLLSWLAVLGLVGILAATGLTPAGALPAATEPLLLLAVAGTAAGGLLVFSARLRRIALAVAARLRVPAVVPFLRSLDAGLGPMAGDRGAWALTVGLRATSTLKYYFALRAFGAPVTLTEAAAAGALLALLLAVPVQGIAGLGTVELWWIAALGLFGTPTPVAAVAGLGTHVALLLFAVVWGAVALAAVPLRRFAGGAVA